MNKAFIILIIITQISYHCLTPINSSKKNNLKKTSKLNQDRKLNDELSDDIVIIHLNDVHCGLNDTIGYDGFVLYRDELKKKYKHIITADVGDHVQGGTLGAISQGTAILQLMNKITFDVNTLGNHEFDYGIEQLEYLNNNMITKYICSNFRRAGANVPIYKPYKIVEAGDKKIAFVGVVTPLTFTKTYICTLKDSNGDPLYDFHADYDDLANTVQNYVNKARNEDHADYVILLTHIGMNIEDYTSNGLVSKIESVDAVLDGHTHLVYHTTSGDKNGKSVYFTQTGTKLANIGQLIIKTDGTIETSIIEEVPEPTDKTVATKVTRGKVDRWVNTEMNTFIDGLWEQYSSELNILIGTVDFDLRVFPGESRDSHANICRVRECPLGNLIADSFREVVKSDIALVNGGTVRTDLLKGQITSKNIIDVMPFFNSVFVKEIDGQTLLDALEFGVSRTPNVFGGFPQVSGMTFDVDTSINSTVVTDSNGAFKEVTGKRKVSNVKVNGEDLILSKKYNISVSEFVGGGGDGYSMFIKYQVVNESIFTDCDALSHYINYELKGQIPEDYKNETTRIIFKERSDDDDDDDDDDGDDDDDDDDIKRVVTKIRLFGEYLKIYKTLPLLLLFALF